MRDLVRPINQNEETYATITTSSPKAAVLLYAALSPAAHIEACKEQTKVEIKKERSQYERKRLSSGKRVNDSELYIHSL